jgi:YEATS domain-containing protein 4
MSENQVQQHLTSESRDETTSLTQRQLPLSSTTTTTTQNFISSQLNSRLDRTTVCLPIVHGSVAFYLGKRAENKNEYQSHQWTLYLRGLNNEDLSTCIQKVVFQLHPSFAQPIREYTHPPYEVTEKGWGEFEAQIRIYWKDPSEQMTMV